MLDASDDRPERSWLTFVVALEVRYPVPSPGRGVGS